MEWTAVPVHMIDFEGCLRSGIVEYGVVTLVNGRVESSANRLCRSVGPVWTEDTLVHGLTKKDLADRAPFSDEWRFFSELRTTGVLAAHFAGTEKRLLRNVWPYPRTSPDFVSGSGAVTDWGPWIDTGRMVIGFRPELPSAGLGEVVKSLGLSSELDELAGQHCPEGRDHFHCAPYDALAAALVLRLLAYDRSGNPLTLQRLMEESTADSEKRIALQQRRLF
jgi:DNA polymerase III epsilon subunit-like protein